MMDHSDIRDIVVWVAYIIIWKKLYRWSDECRALSYDG